MKRGLWMVFFLATLGSQAWAQVTTSVQSVSSSSISRTSVSSQRLSTARGGSATSPYDKSNPVTTAYGEALGKPVIPPEVKNTTLVRAHYIRPSLGNGGQAFAESSTQQVRLPLATKKEVYWVPNQKSLIAE